MHRQYVTIISVKAGKYNLITLFYSPNVGSFVRSRHHAQNYVILLTALARLARLAAAEEAATREKSVLAYDMYCFDSSGRGPL